MSERRPILARLDRFGATLTVQDTGQIGGFLNDWYAAYADIEKLLAEPVTVWVRYEDYGVTDGCSKPLAVCATEPDLYDAESRVGMRKAKFEVQP